MVITTNQQERRHDWRPVPIPSTWRAWKCGGARLQSWKCGGESGVGSSRRENARQRCLIISFYFRSKGLY